VAVAEAVAVAVADAVAVAVAEAVAVAVAEAVAVAVSVAVAVAEEVALAVAVALSDGIEDIDGTTLGVNPGEAVLYTEYDTEALISDDTVKYISGTLIDCSISFFDCDIFDFSSFSIQKKRQILENVDE
jgi:hypothetical protein